MALFLFAMLALVTVLPAAAQGGAGLVADAVDGSNARGDDLIRQMSQAYRRGDKARLTQLLPQARGHPLEPWAAYWELKVRLEDATALEVREFLARYAGTYQEDRLRNDWLLLLGQRRDWAGFAAEYPALRMGDDREVRCYARLIDFLRTGGISAGQVDEVRRDWLSLREADDGCTLAADHLFSARRIGAADAWRKARQALEGNRPRVARAAVEIVAPEALKTLTDLLERPAQFLAGLRGQAPSRLHRQLAVLALIKVALNDPGAAAGLLEGGVGAQLSSEERDWAWGAAGRQAAVRLASDEALAYFAKVEREANLSDDTLGWMARAALRAGQWPRVLQAIQAMSEEARREPVWVYWKARALQRRARPGEVAASAREARALYESIASPRGFYEQLALEELGLKIDIPARPRPLTAEEKEAARRNPGLARGLYALLLGLRPEGVNEWNYSVRLVNARGQPGRLGDRELLAAAQLACEHQVWDRCINTSEHTQGEADYEQRFPTPYRDAVVRRTREIGLDAAYVYGLIRQESRFVMDARSSAGASGLMQLMPATARWTARKLGLERFDPRLLTEHDTNIAIGTGYLKLLLEDFAGSLPLAAAAYNAGPGRPRGWRNGPLLEAAIWAESLPFAETRDYVKKVLANTTVYAALLSGQPQSLKARLGQVGPREVSAPVADKDIP